jgi:hypothetical protein
MHENREISWTSWSQDQDRSVKAINRTTDTNVQEKSDRAVVCAEQRVVQEGSSPSGDRMRITVSKSGGNASLAEGKFSSEGRVSVARRNPKGMRRSTGP